MIFPSQLPAGAGPLLSPWLLLQVCCLPLPGLTPNPGLRKHGAVERPGLYVKRYCVTFGKFLNLSEPYFLRNYIVSIMGLRQLSELICMKRLAHRRHSANTGSPYLSSSSSPHRRAGSAVGAGKRFQLVIHRVNLEVPRRGHPDCSPTALPEWLTYLL